LDLVKKSGKTLKIGHRIYSFFSYLDDKQWDPSKKEQAERLLTILFDRILHNRYFAKLPFGSREKFAKNDQYYIIIGCINMVTPALGVFLQNW
jgi:hypothetical protein